MNNGLLFLIGGAEDRQGEKQVLRQLVERTQASRIVIVPTASAYPKDATCDFTDAFADLGIADVACLDIRYRDEADRDDHLNALETADVVFFSGGDQVKLVNTLKHTQFIDLVRTRFNAGKLHVAGTSAGATAAGNPMIYYGNRNGLKKGSVRHAEGFGFITGVTIDTHFSVRKRLSRLSQFLISGHCQRGLGLDEDTGIVIDADLHFEVIGSGMVTVLDSSAVNDSNFNSVRKGSPLRFTNMRLGVLPAGSRFNIREWAVINRSSDDHERETSPLWLAAN
jgi:cyanophycinase